MFSLEKLLDIFRNKGSFESKISVYSFRTQEEKPYGKDINKLKLSANVKELCSNSWAIKVFEEDVAKSVEKIISDLCTKMEVVTDEKYKVDYMAGLINNEFYNLINNCCAIYDWYSKNGYLDEKRLNSFLKDYINYAIGIHLKLKNPASPFRKDTINHIEEFAKIQIENIPKLIKLANELTKDDFITNKNLVALSLMYCTYLFMKFESRIKERYAILLNKYYTFKLITNTNEEDGIIFTLEPIENKNEREEINKLPPKNNSQLLVFNPELKKFGFYVVQKINDLTNDEQNNLLKRLDAEKAIPPVVNVMASKPKDENKIWFKVGLLFANGDMDKLLLKHKRNCTAIAKELGNKNYRPYISDTVGGTNNSSNKNIYSNPDKVKKIYDHCNANNLPVTPAFKRHLPAQPI